MTRVVFACDAGPIRGIGHVMRCLALAEELAAREVDCVFVADLADVPWAAAQVTARGFAIRQHAQSHPGLAATIIDLAPDAVVLDSYDAPPAVSADLRSAGVPLLTIVDGETRGQTGDLYVDQNLGSEHLAGPLDAPRLAGLGYALLRTEVLRLRPPAPPTGARQDPPRVLAYFGGTDAYGAGPLLAAALVASGEAFDATFVAPRPRLRAAIDDLPVGAGQRITAIDPTDALMSLAVDADVVISASGTSLWELLCLGAATAIVWVIDNQELGYGRVMAAGLAAGLGHLDDVRADPSDAAKVLGTLLRDVAWRDRLRAIGWALVDGLGRARVADALLALTVK
jgi:spore coat polysaccharide biosynthesis predicted glycosyltransferase SpsG